MSDFSLRQNPGTNGGVPSAHLLVLALLIFVWLLMQLSMAGYVGHYDDVKSLVDALPQGLWQSITTFGDGRALFALFLPLSVRYRKLVWPIVLAGLAGWLISRGLKVLLHMPRPAALLAAASASIPDDHQIHNSFPSGHTTVVFSFVGVLITALPRVWALPLIAFAALVGTSRIAIGLHWPIDVLGGALTGCLAAYIGVRVGSIWTWGDKQRNQSILILLMALSVISLPFIDRGSPESLPLRIILVCIALASIALLHAPAVFSQWIAASPLSRLLRRRSH